MNAKQQYAIVTANYWAFTLTDGALRMLVLLYFYQLGYSPLALAMLFLFYEFFGIVTNLLGGWLGARAGLNVTMNLGLAIQIAALAMLTVPEAWLSVAYVMVAQAFSGIAKDLNKMSAKSSVKALTSDATGGLYRWVAVLTGSKNALKGVGFFLGAVLLEWVGFTDAMWIMIALLSLALLISLWQLDASLGKASHKPKFAQMFSHSSAVNWLSAARFFLFGARDVWFVVALPVFAASVLGWSHSEIGAFMALWIIGYGVVQATTPQWIGRRQNPTAKTALILALILAAVPLTMALMLSLEPQLIVLVGLVIFGVLFALNSAVHSYLIVAYADADGTSKQVGFYYMANAGGRLVGTLLSGYVYQVAGLEACLAVSSAMILLAGVMAIRIGKQPEDRPSAC
ncbi:MAG: MFS transporter [Thiotrichales bacterium 32-46-8]|nr:MAG: MFS transporter [Thiotrichales bacterium 32-46-8]OYY24352.1 MAG: MFS transporter [Thiotrichales bacterium 35-46-9]OZA20201.1 MAG: MFS transporter [Thiotrichales bacterium 17-46-47]OZA98081.1 MAG: MFS transporter [Thiotrichales bacterium 34-46-19]OZB87090.1 MAG: MFS transporter [Thiotrichales bacterium 12-47-6]UCG18011.1 MAG: organoarsenical effux MFS transporter ArsJ [Thiotrichales bacterium]